MRGSPNLRGMGRQESLNLRLKARPVGKGIAAATVEHGGAAERNPGREIAGQCFRTPGRTGAFGNWLEGRSNDGPSGEKLKTGRQLRLTGRAATPPPNDRLPDGFRNDGGRPAGSGATRPKKPAHEHRTRAGGSG